MAVKRAHAHETKETITRQRPAADESRLRNPEVPEFDPLIHERIRLGLLSALAVNPSLTVAGIPAEAIEYPLGNRSARGLRADPGNHDAAERSFGARGENHALRGRLFLRESADAGARVHA